MMAETSSSRAWVALGVLFPGLAVVVGWWVTAEGAREEALRADRRVAYTAMVKAANECGTEATFSSAVPIVRDAIGDVANEPGFEAFAQQVDRAAAEISPSPREVMEQVQGCFTGVTTAATRVRLVTDDLSVWRALRELQSATLAVPYQYNATSEELEGDDRDGVAVARFLDAQVAFEDAAQDEVHQPAPFFPRSTGRVVAPLILTVGLYLPLVAAVLVGIALVRWVGGLRR